jgi:prevent-host-death family protein
MVDILAWIDQNIYMRQVGVYEAKSQLSRLLDDVERGETITITRHGKLVAQLGPVECRRRRPMAELIEEFRAVRESEKPIGVRMKELINEGRRF